MFISIDDLKKKSMTKITFNRDPILLSVVLERVNKQGNFTSIQDDRLSNFVTDIDVEYANSIRKYFLNKVLEWKLKGVPLTRFREDLVKVLANNSNDSYVELIPIIRSLPKMFEYDKEFMPMLALPQNKANNGSIKKEVFKLTFLTRINDLKHMIEYWFTDEERIYCFRKDSRDPLLVLWENYLSLNKDISVRSSIVHPTKRNGLTFFKFDKHTLLLNT